MSFWEVCPWVCLKTVEQMSVIWAPSKPVLPFSWDCGPGSWGVTNLTIRWVSRSWSRSGVETSLSREDASISPHLHLPHDDSVAFESTPRSKRRLNIGLMSRLSSCRGSRRRLAVWRFMHVHFQSLSVVTRSYRLLVCWRIDFRWFIRPFNHLEYRSDSR